MSAAVLSLLVVAQLSAGERTPAVLMIETPKGVSTGISSATIVRAATDAIEHDTELAVISLEQGGVDSDAMRRCDVQERLTCWTRTVTGAMKDARFLFSVTLHPGNPDRVAMTLIDLRCAETIIRETASRAVGEDLLFEASPRTELVALSLEPKPPRTYVKKCVEDELPHGPRRIVGPTRCDSDRRKRMGQRGGRARRSRSRHGSKRGDDRRRRATRRA